MFNSSLGVLFAVEKYAKALHEIVKERNIQLNLSHELIEVKPESREAVFRILNQPEGSTKTFKVLESSEILFKRCPDVFGWNAV